MQTFAQYFFGITLFLTSLFLVLLVLVQRGRGGGLAGALGGAGGQSAFGTKAGDVFTKITCVAAAIWIILCLTSIGCLSRVDNKLDESLGAGANTAPRDTETEVGDPAGTLDNLDLEGGGLGGLNSGSSTPPMDDTTNQEPADLTGDDPTDDSSDTPPPNPNASDEGEQNATENSSADPTETPENQP